MFEDLIICAGRTHACLSHVKLAVDVWNFAQLWTTGWKTCVEIIHRSAVNHVQVIAAQMQMGSKKASFSVPSVSI